MEQRDSSREPHCSHGNAGIGVSQHSAPNSSSNPPAAHSSPGLNPLPSGVAPSQHCFLSQLCPAQALCHPALSRATRGHQNSFSYRSQISVQLQHFLINEEVGETLEPHPAVQGSSLQSHTALRGRTGTCRASPKFTFGVNRSPSSGLSQHCRSRLQLFLQ